jgi:multidrug efflux pump subunit AcrA (membrane-fusion protein)
MENRQKRSRRRGWIWTILVLVVCLLLTFYWVLRPKAAPLATMTIQLSTLNNTVFESGTVTATEQQFVFLNQLPSAVSSFPVPVGGHIQKGDVLVHVIRSTAVPSYVSAGPLPTARFSGTVIEENADGVASDGSQVPVLEITSNAKQIVSQASEVDAVHITSGMVVSMTSDAYPGQTFTGRVSRVAAYAALSSAGTGQVEVDITPTGVFRIPLGFQVNIHIRTATHHQVPVVPYESLVQNGDNYSVFVVRHGHVYETPVTLGITSNSSVEVVKGVHAGDVVVLNPASSLVSGQAVGKTS